MTLKNEARSSFLDWTSSDDPGWPEVDEDGFAVALFERAIQECLLEYLKSKDLSPLRRYLEKCIDNIAGSKIAEKREHLSPIANELSEVYGASGNFSSAWRVQKKYNSQHFLHNYLTYGVHTEERSFRAKDAYYLPNRTPITKKGREDKQEIFELVNEELDQFEEVNGKNLLDYYLSISAELWEACSRVPGLDEYSAPPGKNIFEKSEFQERVLNEFVESLSSGLELHFSTLSEHFPTQEDFSKLVEGLSDDYRSRLNYPLRQKVEFLYGHFYKIFVFQTDEGTDGLQKLYGEDSLTAIQPFFPALLQRSFERQIQNIFRESENQYRKGLGLKGVGEGWVSETQLFAKLRKRFPNEEIIQHAHLPWLGRQHLDVFFPRLNVAVEYQGEQHHKPIAIFGGKAGFEVTQKRDQKKRDLCEANHCTLIEVTPEDIFESVAEEISEIISSRGKSPETATCVSESNETPPAPVEKKFNVAIEKLKPKKKATKSGSWKKNLSEADLPSCARHGSSALIQELHDAGHALEEFRNKLDETLLFIACKEGNVETAETLLQVGLDPNARNYREATILSLICNQWSVTPLPKIVELLLDGGADPTLHGTLTPAIFDRCGYALPMNGCAIEGYLECAQILHEHEGHVNQVQPDSNLTPIMCACHRFDRHSKHHRSIPFIEWLLENGADLEMKSALDLAPLDFALGVCYYNKQHRAKDVASKELLEILISAGAKPSENFKEILELALNR